MTGRVTRTIAAWALVVTIPLLPMRDSQAVAHQSAATDWVVESTITTSVSGAGGIADVVFLTPRDGWAVGSGGGLYVTHDAGQTWSTQNSGTTDDLRRVIFTTPKVGYVVGGQTVLRTGDSGRTWRRLPSPDLEDSDYFIADVAAPTPSRVFIAGGGELYSLDLSAQQTTWTLRNTGNSLIDWVGNLAFPDPHIGWLSGTAIRGDALWQTTNGGAAWTQTSIGANHVSFMRFPTAALGYVAYNFTSLAITADGGATWVQRSIPQANQKVRYLSFLSGTQGLAATINAILATHDGGQTWQAQSLPDNLPKNLITVVGYRGSTPFAVVAGRFLSYGAPSPAPSATATPNRPALETLVPSQNAIVAGTTVPFTWRPYPQATYYYLQVWLTRLATGAAITRSSVTTVSTRVTGTHDDLDAHAMPRGTYVWRMVAVTASGELVSAWTPERTFTLQ